MGFLLDCEVVGEEGVFLFYLLPRFFSGFREDEMGEVDFVVGHGEKLHRNGFRFEIGDNLGLNAEQDEFHDLVNRVGWGVEADNVRRVFGVEKELLVGVGFFPNFFHMQVVAREVFRGHWVFVNVLFEGLVDAGQRLNGDDGGNVFPFVLDAEDTEELPTVRTD